MKKITHLCCLIFFALTILSCEPEEIETNIISESESPGVFYSETGDQQDIPPTKGEEDQ